MSEERYFGHDERTSAEIPVYDPVRLEPLLSLAREPNIDEVLEEEPDPDLLMTSGLDKPKAILAPLSLGEAEAETEAGLVGDDISPYVVQRPQTPVTASGGLGPGNAPDEENSNRGKYLEIPSEPSVANWEGEYLEDDSFNLPHDSQHQMEQQKQQRPDLSSPRTRARNFLRREENHSKELNGELPREKERRNRSYSSSASSESVSDDEYSVQPGREGDQRNSMDWTTTSTHHRIQTGPPKPSNTIGPDKNQFSSEDDEWDVSETASSNMGNTHSSFLHSWPHLSEVTPADVQGHHPSIISRSPRKGTSRASSAASENEPGVVEESQLFTEASLHEKGLHPTMEASKIFQSHLSPLKVESHLSLVVADNGSSFSRRPEEKRSYSSSRASPLRRPTDFTDAASTLAVIKSPMPILLAVPCRPDTPRPLNEPERLGVFDHLYLQPVSPTMCILDQDTKPTQAQYDHEVATETPSRIAERIVKVKSRLSTSSPRLQAIISHSLPHRMPWQGSQVATDVFERCLPQAWSEDPPKILLGPRASASPGASILELTSVPPIKDSLPSSPFTGLQTAIRCKRRSRKTTTLGHTARRDMTITRGRAVSVLAKKEKASTNSGNPPATGVQGVNIKVTKTRSKKPAGYTGQKDARLTNESISAADDIPKVPDLPENLLLYDQSCAHDR